MATENAIVSSLRKQIELKYQEALRALDTLSAYLEGATLPQETQSVQRQESETDSGGTTVDQVLAVVTDTFKTVRQISKETGISEDSVRAVLYSKFVKRKMLRKKINNLTAFKLTKLAPTLPNGEQKSAAALVRETLAKHPSGLTTGAIMAAVGDQVEKMTGSKAAIGAALYNGKTRGKFRYDEATGVYTISS